MPSCHIRLTSYKTIHIDTHADIPLQRFPKSLLESLATSSKVSLLHAIATAKTASISSLKTPSLFPPQSFYTCCLLEWNGFLIAIQRLFLFKCHLRREDISDFYRKHLAFCTHSSLSIPICFPSHHWPLHEVLFISFLYFILLAQELKFHKVRSP